MRFSRFGLLFDSKRAFCKITNINSRKGIPTEAQLTLLLGVESSAAAFVRLRSLYQSYVSTHPEDIGSALCFKSSAQNLAYSSAFSPMDNEVSRLISTQEICDFLGLSYRTIFNIMKNDPSFPKPLPQKIGNRFLFDRADIEVWALNQKSTKTPVASDANASAEASADAAPAAN